MIATPAPLAPSVVLSFFAAMLPAPAPAAFGLPSAGDEAGPAPAGVQTDTAPLPFDSAFTDTPIVAPVAPPANEIPQPNAELAFALRLADQTPNAEPAWKTTLPAPLEQTPAIPVTKAAPAPPSPAPLTQIAATTQRELRPAESARPNMDDGSSQEQSSQSTPKPERPRADRQIATFSEQKPPQHTAAAEIATQENRTVAAPIQTIAPAPTAIPSSPLPSIAPRAVEPSAATVTAAVDHSPITPARAERPSEVTEISVTVPVSRADSANEERVAIRMVQRGSEIHVSVRTPDREVAQAMRQDLSRLAASLEDAGFRSEAWRPATSNVAAPSQTQAQREFSQETAHRDSATYDGRSGGNSGRGPGEQKRRQQDDRPRWVAELEQQRNR